MIQVWPYGTDFVLDGNSLKWEISAQALKTIEKEIPAGEPKKNYGHTGALNKRCGYTRRYSIQKVWTSNSLTPMQRSTHTWEFLWLIHGILSDVLDLMVLVHGIDSNLLRPRFLVPLYWFSMVFLHGFSNGLPIKREGDHLASHLWNLNILRFEILGDQFEK